VLDDHHDRSFIYGRGAYPEIVDSHLRIVQSFAVGNGISDPLRCPRSVPPESTAVAAVVADMNATMGRAIEKLLTPAPVADGIRKN
jgi:hypothetical protein